MITLCNPINKTNQFDESLTKQITELAAMFNCDICRIFLFDDDEQFVKVKSSYIKDNESLDNYKDSVYLKDSTTNSLFYLLLKEHQIIIYNKGEDSHNNEQYSPYIDNIEEEVYIPIFSQAITHDEIIGCLYLGMFNDQIEIIEKLNQYEIRAKIKRIQYNFNAIYEKHRENTTLLNIIHIFFVIIRDREPFMVNHPYNAAYWSDSIAEKLKLNLLERHNLYMASVLHDVGKIYIKQAILNKKGKLTTEEYNIIKNHSIYSYNIVKEIINGVVYLNNLPTIVKHHHERYDGKGYPDGLKGEEIPLMSRIIGIADAVDAMLSERSYKKTKSIDEVINELLENKGKQFDPEIVDIMVDILKGNLVTDNNDIMGPITWSTLLFSTKSKDYAFQGSLIKRESGYEFQFRGDKNELRNFDINKITNSILYFEREERIFEYIPKLQTFKRDHIFISNLSFKPLNKYFSLLWNIPGKIGINSSSNYDVAITELGGDCIKFNIDKENSSKLNKNVVYFIEFKFEDETPIAASGKIMKSYEIGYNVYHEFKFININESLRSSIFKHLFEKQTKLMR
jgi:HD-GYP domain-containing protein (c-di-GMP phosphodiesterase class II)